MWTGKLKMGKAPKIKSLQKGVQAIREGVAQLAFLNIATETQAHKVFHILHYCHFYALPKFIYHPTLNNCRL